MSARAALLTLSSAFHYLDSTGGDHRAMIILHRAYVNASNEVFGMNIKTVFTK